MRAQPLRGAPWAGQVPPSGLGAEVPGAASHGEWPGRGCGDVPWSLQRSPTFPLLPPSSLVPSPTHPWAPASPAPAAPAAISLPPSPAEPLLSLLLQAMAVGITHILTVLSIVQYALRVGDRTDAATQDLLQQHEEQQSREMTWLLEEMEQRSQEPRGLLQEGVLLAAGQHWWFWASAETLLILLGLCWLPRQRSADSKSGSQQGSSSSAEREREEDDWEDKADPYDTLGQDKSLDKVGTSTAFAKPLPRTPF